jgi:hypothetical protein
MYLQKTTFIIFACATLLSAARFAVTRPNFGVIFVDDMGYADIGPFGAS